MRIKMLRFGSMQVRSGHTMKPWEAIVAAVVLLVLRQPAAAVAEAAVMPGCPPRCGEVSVPYPFGISPGCYWPGFNLTCDTTHSPPKLLIGNGTLQVVNISLPDATVRVLGPSVDLSNYNGMNASGTWRWLIDDGPYFVSEKHNRFTLTGCHVLAQLIGRTNNTIAGCASFCSISDTWRSDPAAPTSSTCDGISCCQTSISIGRPSYDVRLRMVTGESAWEVNKLIYAFIAEQGWFENGIYDRLLQPYPNSTPPAPKSVPVVLGWSIGTTWGSGSVQAPDMMPNSTCPAPTDAASSACRSAHSSCRNATTYYRSGYVCQCWDGYQGNPYLTDGCQDIDECKSQDKCHGECTNVPGSFHCRCPRGARGNPYIKDGCVKSSTGLSVGLGVGSAAGLLLLVLGGSFVIGKLKRRRAQKLRQKFFKQNRGHLLQQLVSQRADIAERMIIPLEELEKGTNNFDKGRELGGGGHGTVYKGILSDLQVVAIKKSKITIQREVDEFINEVAILSQINHRNVVKLFGCCLETEVPLLVYEFISNGTLYDHLHIEGPTSLSWEDRLRIATETARAVAYLHSAVSIPIIHRDIKSHNILLDGILAAKVSDFGASRYIPVDQTGVTTVVQGTLGYLDPMYYYTGRLTEKSDVYSFGVILIELLTRKKPFSYRSPKDDSLVAHFSALLAEDNLVHILDPQVLEEGGSEVKEVATLAAVCVNLRGEDRPTMRLVEMTLESLRASQNRAVLTSVGAERYKESHIAMSSAPTEARNKETSRQYSLEEEYLLSARYPR